MNNSMAQYIDKNEVENILRKLWKEDDGHNPEHRICYNKELEEVQYELDTLEVEDEDSFDATVCKIGNTYLKEIEKDAITKVLEPYKNGDKVKVIIKAQKENKL